MKANEGGALVVMFGCMVRFLPPHFAKCGGWLGCGCDDEFSFLCEQSERTECAFYDKIWVC